MFSFQDTEDSEYNFDFASNKNLYGSYDESESRESYSTAENSSSFNNFPTNNSNTIKSNISNSNPVRNSIQSTDALLSKANSYLSKGKETRVYNKNFNKELDEDELSYDSDSDDDSRKNKNKKFQSKSSFTSNKSFPSRPIDSMEDSDDIGIEVKGIEESVYESYDENDDEEDDQNKIQKKVGFIHNKSDNSIDGDYNEEFEEEISEEIADEYEESISEENDEDYSHPPLNESLENGSYSRIQYGNDETLSINEEEDIQKPNILPFSSVLSQNKDLEKSEIYGDDSDFEASQPKKDEIIKQVSINNNPLISTYEQTAPSKISKSVSNKLDEIENKKNNSVENKITNAKNLQANHSESLNQHTGINNSSNYPQSQASSEHTQVHHPPQINSQPPNYFSQSQHPTYSNPQYPQPPNSTSQYPQSQFPHPQFLHPPNSIPQYPPQYQYPVPPNTVPPYMQQYQYPQPPLSIPQYPQPPIPMPQFTQPPIYPPPTNPIPFMQTYNQCYPYYFFCQMPTYPYPPPQTPSLNNEASEKSLSPQLGIQDLINKLNSSSLGNQDKSDKNVYNDLSKSISTPNILTQQPVVIELLQELNKAQEEANWARNKLAETILKYNNLEKSNDEYRNSYQKTIPNTNESNSTSIPKAPVKVNESMDDYEDDYEDEYSEDFDVSQISRKSVSPKKKSQVNQVPIQLNSPTFSNLPQQSNSPTRESETPSQSTQFQYTSKSFNGSLDPLSESLTKSFLASQELLRTKLEAIRLRLNSRVQSQKEYNSEIENKISPSVPSLSSLQSSFSSQQHKNSLRLSSLLRETYPHLNENEIHNLIKKVENTN